MPQLPTYAAPQVTPQAAPSGVLNVQARDLGQAVGAGLRNVAQDVQEIQFQADHLVSEDTTNKFKEYQLQRVSQFKALQGSDAFKPSEETGLSPAEQMEQDLKNYRDMLSQDLGPGARRLFTVKTDPALLAAKETGLVHTANEERVYRTGTALGTYAVEGAAVAADPRSEKQYRTSLDNVLMAVDLEHPGIPKVQRDAIVAAKTSDLFYGRVLAVAKQDPFYAKQLLEANPGTLVGQQKLHAQELVESEYLGARADQLLDGIDGPVDNQLRKPETTVLAEITKAAGGDQHLKDRLIQNYGLRKGALKADDTTKGQELGGAVAGIAGTQGYGAALNSTELASMLVSPSPLVKEEGLKWKEHIISQMRSNETHARSQPLTPVQQAALIRYMEDPAMPTWKDSAVQALQPEIGVKGVMELQAFAHQVRTTPAKQQQLHEDMDQLKVELSLINNPATGKPFIDATMKPAEVDQVLRPFAYRLKQKQEADGVPWSLETTRRQIRELSVAVPTGDTERGGFLWLNKTPVVQPFVTALGSTEVSASFTKAFTDEAARAWQLDPAHKGKPFPGVSSLALLTAYGRAKLDGRLDASGNYVPKTSLTIGGK